MRPPDDPRETFRQVLQTVKRHVERQIELGIPQPREPAATRTATPRRARPAPTAPPSEPRSLGEPIEEEETMARETPPTSEGPALFDLPEEPGAKRRLNPYMDLGMEELRAKASVCVKCPLHQTRTNVVFGAGDPNADLMFVGEAPGHDEDLKGIPFVGRAGQLLTKIINAMGLTRDEVYIANVLKCRPPQNRNPLPEEVDQCHPYLLRQIELIQPKVIVGLGTFAVQVLLDTKERITQLRGRFHEIYGGAKVMPTYHPAFLLRNPAAKRQVWEDMQLVMAELGIEPKRS